MPKKKKKGEDYTKFLVSSGNYVPTGNPTLLTKLPPGVYTVNTDMRGSVYFSEKNVLTSRYIELPTMVTSSIVTDIETFWKKETKEKFDKFGIVYKRGSIMHGEPGTGKTCTVFKVVSKVVEMGGIAIYDPDPSAFSDAIKILHSIQGETPVVCVFEEFDRYCQGPSFLSLLDGDLQVPSIYYLATTNFIDKIPESIKNRPSRFARIIQVGKPDVSARETYIKSILGEIEPGILNVWVKKTENMVLDQIKDMIISVECFNETIDSAREKALCIDIEEKNKNNDENDYDYDRIDRFDLAKNNPYGLREDGNDD
ncbi:AAA family ATPase [bacterium]|nr:AAA family ATPase [bacterium]